MRSLPDCELTKTLQYLFRDFIVTKFIFFYFCWYYVFYIILGKFYNNVRTHVRMYVLYARLDQCVIKHMYNLERDATFYYSDIRKKFSQFIAYLFNAIALVKLVIYNQPKICVVFDNIQRWTITLISCKQSCSCACY